MNPFRRAYLSVLCTFTVPATLAASPVCNGPDPLPVDVYAQRFVLFGETHGTKEIPALVAQHVCRLLSAGHTVVLAVEMSSDEQPAIDQYLSSRGEPSDVKELIRSKQFWQRPQDRQDGRSSQAKVDLLEAVRRHRMSGQPVSVKAIDVGAEDFRTHPRMTANDRDAAMARRLKAAMHQSGESKVVALLGNVHTSIAKGAPWDSTYEPTGYLLQADQAYSINVSFRKGSVWACMPTCGPQAFPLRPASRTPEPGFYRLESDTRNSHATLVLDSVSASAPANQTSPAQHQ